jgi:hypothetical protein
MGVRQTALILYLISELAVAVVPAYAVSCRWLEDRYVFVCGEARCAPRFRAREVLSHGSSICARRLVIEEFPDWAVSPTVEVLRLQRKPPVGTLEVVLQHRPWSDAPENEAWLRAALQSPRSDMQIRIALEGEPALRTALQKRSMDELWASRQAWVIDALIITMISVVLIGSYGWFVRRVRRSARRTHLRLLGGALAVDTLLFLLGAVALVTVGDRPMATGLAAPLAIVAAVIEVATFAVARVRGWGVRSPHPNTV